jgi:RiboL-PSP-HEPN
MASAIKPASELLATSTHPDVKAYLSVRRRFDYSALIVALYASFERFVEDILTSYVKTIANQDSYELLPRRLTGKHLQKTAEFLSKGDIDQIRYPGVTHFQLIENLYQCLSGRSPYALNHAAVAAHDRNIRYDELGSLLSLVDLSHNAVRQAQPLIDWYYEDQKMTGPPPSSVPATAVEQRLDNLVERRNDVAHRGGSPSDRLGVDEMQSLVEFVAALARSVFTLFVSHYLRKRHVGATDCERLALVKGPYQKKHVWVVRRPESRLHLKQPVFALSSTFLVRYGRVQKLQINGLDQTSVEPDGTESVGVQLDFPAPRGAEVYVLGSEDESIWPAAIG